MLTGSRSRRWVVLWALPLALWGALPAMRWCPLGWRQACAAALVHCATSEPQAACDGMNGRCPLADAAHGSPVDAACAPAGDCPMARDARDAAPSRPDPFPSGRAYCAGDPNGGAGVLAHSTHVHPAPSLIAVLPLDAPEVPGEAAGSLVPQRASRPPPRPWSRRPPARAPPSLPNT